ncbi:Uncharacterized protein Nst1_144 [Candidatus Nanobsidianus stetteri]|uniref:Uncharacterized protein n=1 Tax=Nanobsidianus stetteri TaxID=1294122 RepID=R1FUM8_NANST|nr:Uncharacterized protein Nst1_144 [Candidatus Nanobsidianus stetteri]
MKKFERFYIYLLKVRCKIALEYLMGLKMEINTFYNTNYKISIKIPSISNSIRY